VDVLIGKLVTPVAIATLISIAPSTDKLAGSGIDAATDLREDEAGFFGAIALIGIEVGVEARRGEGATAGDSDIATDGGVATEVGSTGLEVPTEVDGSDD